MFAQNPESGEPAIARFLCLLGCCLAHVSSWFVKNGDDVVAKRPSEIKGVGGAEESMGKIVGRWLHVQSPRVTRRRFVHWESRVNRTQEGDPRGINQRR